MTLAELVELYEARRAEAARVQATAPVAKLYELVLDELRTLDDRPAEIRHFTTAAAGRALSVHPRTVARMCQAGRLPGAFKTGNEAHQATGRQTGEWRIPSASVYSHMGIKSKKRTPKLWEAD